MKQAGYKPRKFRSLKEAVNALVSANGGITQAAKFCRVQGSTLYRYTDDDTVENAERHMPIDIVAQLEKEGGVAIVTEFLADQIGCLLLPTTSEVSSSDLNIDLAETSNRVAKLFEDWAISVANDGIFDRTEAKTLLLHNIDLVRILMRMRGDLEARIADPNTPNDPVPSI